MNFIKLLFIMKNKKHVLVERRILEDLRLNVIGLELSIGKLTELLYVYNNALRLACEGDEEKTTRIFEESLNQTIIKNVDGDVERINSILSKSDVDVLRNYYDSLLEKS